MSELWLDWCEVTGTSRDQRDEQTLQTFARQARPSKRVMAGLRAQSTSASEEVAQRSRVWPRVRDDERTLQLLLVGLSARIVDRELGWTSRLRLARLAFVAVLVAPRSQGGLALAREAVHALTPAALTVLRHTIGVELESPAGCPACAVSLWLHLHSEASAWSRSAVREVISTAARASGRAEGARAHRCRSADPSRAWTTWPATANLVPAIDRWGYLDLHASLHVSSLSVLLGDLERELVGLPLDQQQLEHEPQGSDAAVTPELRSGALRHITPEEEAAILARADEVHARVRRLLAEFEAG